MAGGVFSDKAREAITNRAHGRCQRCYRRNVDQCHHRRPRGAGGTSDRLAGHPANGIGLCTPCHGWVESHREAALDLGLLVRQGTDPRWVPMWLTLPYGEFWYLVDDEGMVRMDHDTFEARGSGSQL